MACMSGEKRRAFEGKPEGGNEARRWAMISDWSGLRNLLQLALVGGLISLDRTILALTNSLSKLFPPQLNKKPPQKPFALYLTGNP